MYVVCLLVLLNKLGFLCVCAVTNDFFYQKCAILFYFNILVLSFFLFVIFFRVATLVFQS